MYTVLARRYRSQTFDDVVGQDAVAQTLKNAIKTDKVAHAYLFTGTRGVGKTTMARIFAKALNCLNSDKPTITPCLKCDSCINVNLGEDIDVIEIDGASNRSIDNIRELRQNAIYRPTRARFKIYIIDEVHMLTNEAFNALLKILEEPPSHVKFIFATTAPNNVLATVQSRCQRFDFVSISATTITNQLKNILTQEGIEFEEDLLIALGRLANGSMRDSLSLLDQLISAGKSPLTYSMLEEYLGLPDRQKICSLIDAICRADAAGALESVDNLIDGGLAAVQIADALVETFRDMMVIAAAGQDSKLVILSPHEKQILAKLAESFDISALVFNISLLEKLHYPIIKSDNPRALLEAAVLRLALSEHFMNLSDLLGAGSSTAAEGLKKKAVAEQHRPQTFFNGAGNAGKAVSNSAAAAAVPAGPVLNGEINLQEIQYKWPQIIEHTRSSLSRTASFLQLARPCALDGSTLRLEFPAASAFAKDICEGRLEQIQKALSAAVGTVFNLVFELASDRAVHDGYRPKGAKTSQKKIDELTSDPRIKTILQGLNAKIVDITEPPQEQ